MDRSMTTFGLILAFIFDVLHEMFIHHTLFVFWGDIFAFCLMFGLLFLTFSKFPSRVLRHVKFSTNSFNSFLLRSLASSSRY